jgi:hypothetical protein
MYPCRSYKVSIDSLPIPRPFKRISLSSILAPRDTTASPFPKMPSGLSALSPYASFFFTKRFFVLLQTLLISSLVIE